MVESLLESVTDGDSRPATSCYCYACGRNVKDVCRPWQSNRGRGFMLLLLLPLWQQPYKAHGSCINFNTFSINLRRDDRAGAQQNGRGGSQKPAAAGAAMKRIPGSSNTSTAFNKRPGTLPGPGSAKPPAGRVANTSASFRPSPRDDRPATSTSRSSTRPTSCSSATSSTSSLEPKSSDTSTKAEKPQWLQQLKQQQQGSFAAPAQHVTTPGLGSPASAAAATEAAAVSTVAAGEWGQQRHSSQAGPAGHTDSPRMSGGSCAGKEACQPDSLLHGRYDEAAAASSFQEALQQWRQAAPESSSSGSSSTATGAAGTAVDTSSGSNRNLPGRTAVAGSRCGTQGDHSSKAGECCCECTLWLPQTLLH